MSDFIHRCKDHFDSTFTSCHHIALQAHGQIESISHTQIHLLEITERCRLLDVRWHILLHSATSTWHWNGWKRAAMDWAAMCVVWFLEECKWEWEYSHPCSLTIIDGWWISDVMKPTFATNAISGRRAFEQMLFFQRCTFYGCCRAGQRPWADCWWSTRLHFDGRIRSWTLSGETRLIRRGTWSAKRRLRLSDGRRRWRSTMQSIRDEFRLGGRGRNLLFDRRRRLRSTMRARWNTWWNILREVWQTGAGRHRIVHKRRCLFESIRRYWTRRRGRTWRGW